MAEPKTHDAAQRLSERIYGYVQRRALRAIGFSEKQLDKIYADAMTGIRRDLHGLVRHTNGEVTRALKKHINPRLHAERQRIVEEIIGMAAEHGGEADKATFKAVFGEGEPAESPFAERLHSPRKGKLRLLPPPESAAKRR